ncbi:ead/Ea22-like family protein [Salmonella enterica]|nr:ead/Ea22-like family protein [Salmonella enterica subsp. enterica serovar Senftenberg]EBS6058417.1 ead/Ea22-like family protein [Salmonella enterica subsp. enterica serovar Weltevreden]EBS6957255.1 ead/Ea22-like family protein [Salmonella enterica]EGI5033375.1 ead/Ea22-like family protein [Salmonella enterica subsp. enterica serovar Bareilly]ECN4980521.1 ead/Ea22-like family protein [Salmonella enterica subsp. enterica serovar Senftenberg]
MTALNKQALREAAVRAGGGKWIYIRTLSLSSSYITEETGATVINCTAGDVPAKCAGFLELANPAAVLALLDEMEAAEKRIAEHRKVLNSLAAVARRYLPDYDEHPEIQAADELLESAAGIGVKGE